MLDILPLRAARVVLRRFVPSDAKAFFAYRNDPEVARYQSWEGCTDQEAVAFARHHSAQPFGVPGEWLQIAIVLAESNQMIGDCAVRIDSEREPQATIGFTLARSFQCRGFATEALSCLVAALFQTAGVHRIRADTDPRNTAAWSLLERVGFRREGHLRKSLWFKGAWADEFLYGILREEWQHGMASRIPLG